MILYILKIYKMEYFLSNIKEDVKNYNFLINHPKKYINIPIELLQEFYLNYINYDDKLYISEVSSEKPPIIVEFKLEFAHTDTEPYFDIFIYYLIYCQQQVIKENFEISESKKELYCCYLESNVYKNKNKNISILDIKFQFPYCKIEKHDQKNIIIPALIKKLFEINPLSHANLQPIGDWNTIIKTDTFDKPILLYNSISETNSSPLEFKYIVDEIDDEILEYSDYKIKKLEVEDIFDIENNKYVQENIINEKIFENYEYLLLLPLFLSTFYYNKITLKKKNISNKTNNNNTNNYIDKNGKFKILEKLIEFLDKSRFLDPIYHKHIGICCYNTTIGHECGFNLWIKMSKKYKSEFIEDIEECKYEYNSFVTCVEKYDVETIAFYAQEDNSVLYNEWHDEWVRDAVKEILLPKKILDGNIQKAIYRQFWLTNKVIDISKKTWTNFNGNRWVEDPKGISLKLKITEDFHDKILILYNNLSKKNHGDDGDKFEVSSDALKKLLDILSNLKTESKLKTYMSGIEVHFYDSNFIKNRDTNGNLTCNLNCVIEVCDENIIVRKGKPQDFLSMCTHMIYPKHYTENSIEVKNLRKWYKQIFIEPELIEWVYLYDSSFLEAGNNDKLLPIHTGANGNNSKSARLKLLNQAWGDYNIAGSDSILFGKQNDNSGPTPHLARMEKKRRAYIIEPDANRTFSDGKVKTISGGDSTYARNNYSDGGDIKPTAVVELYTNEIPGFDNIGDAVKSRVTPIPYNSIWSFDAPVSEEEQFKQRHFLRDNGFDKKISKMASAHMWLCVQYWKKYKQRGLPKIKIIQDAKNNYWKKTDLYYQFINESIDSHSDNKFPPLSLAEIYKEFSMWYKQNFPALKVPARNMLNNELNARWGESKKAEWKNYCLRGNNLDI